MNPWGPLAWLTSKLPSQSASNIQVLGCVGSEDRCIALPCDAIKRGIKQITLIHVRDPPSRYSAVIKARTEANLARIAAQLGHPPNVMDVDLLATDDAIVDCLALGLQSGAQEFDLWFDISCLPKRFFFLLLKIALRDTRIGTLIVTYTQPVPGGYTDDHLAEDPESIAPLPGFGPIASEPPQKLIVGVGFEALGLPQLLGEYRDQKREVLLLLPFPPGQPYSRRIWEMVRLIGGYPDKGGSIRRVCATDAFAVYEELIATNMEPSVSPPALAPYGPKPVSLGMCLYAIINNSPVFYTQPRLYHPEYTRGIGDVWAYCLKMRGREVLKVSRHDAEKGDDRLR